MSYVNKKYFLVCAQWTTGRNESFFADKVYDEHLFVALKGELSIIGESYNIINYKEIIKEEYDLYRM